MTKTVNELVDRAMALNAEQRIELLCELMDRFADDHDLLTDELKAELDKRAAFMDEHPEALIPKDEVLREIRDELGLRAES